MTEEQQPNKRPLPKGYVPYPTASYRHYIGWHMLASWGCHAVTCTLLLMLFGVFGATEVMLTLFALPSLLSGFLAGVLVKFLNLRRTKGGQLTSIVVSLVVVVCIYGLLFVSVQPLLGGPIWPYITVIVIAELIATFALFDLLPTPNAEYENEDSVDTSQ